MSLWILRNDDERFVCNVKLSETPFAEVKVAHLPRFDISHNTDAFVVMPYWTTTFRKQVLYAGWGANIPVTRSSNPEYIARTLSDELVQAFRRYTRRGNADALYGRLCVHASATLDHAKLPCRFVLRWDLREPYVVADWPIPIDMIVAGLEPDPMSYITISHTITEE